MFPLPQHSPYFPIHRSPALLVPHLSPLQQEPGTRRFGVCFADTATAEFNLTHIEDDVAHTTLETLIVQMAPKELVLCKGNLSKEALRVLRSNVGSAEYNFLEEDSQFWSAETTQRSLALGHYFERKSAAGEAGDEEEKDAVAEEEEKDAVMAGEGHTGPEANWPSALRDALTDEPLLSAVGGLVSYFKSLLIDKDLLSQVSGKIREMRALRSPSIPLIFVLGELSTITFTSSCCTRLVLTLRFHGSCLLATLRLSIHRVTLQRTIRLLPARHWS